jgi:hypothetical protein
MIEVFAAWTWIKTNWRLVALAGAVMLVCLALWKAYDMGYSAAKADCTAQQLEATTTALDTLMGRLEAASKKGAALETALTGLRAIIPNLMKEIDNVLPPKDADMACDLPAAARGLQNRASGYRD